MVVNSKKKQKNKKKKKNAYEYNDDEYDISITVISHLFIGSMITVSR